MWGVGCVCVQRKACGQAHNKLRGRMWLKCHVRGTHGGVELGVHGKQFFVTVSWHAQMRRRHMCPHQEAKLALAAALPPVHAVFSFWRAP